MTDDKHVQHFISSKSREGESVVHVLKAYVPRGKRGKSDPKDALFPGRLILTNQRICYLRKGLLGEDFESINLDEVRSSENRSLLGHRTLKIYSVQNELTVNSFEKKPAFDAFVDALQTACDACRFKQAGEPEASPTSQLQMLAELHRNGVISDEEFSAKKQDLLARI